MNDLKQILFSATKQKIAIGHFNISDLEQFRAVVLAAREFGTPIMIGVSEGERNFIGLKQSVYLAKAFQEEFEIPIFLNADHSKKAETARAACDAGFDSVHIDLSELPYEENVRLTKEFVFYAKSKNPEISVEGELGILRGKSEIQKEKISVSEKDLTSPEQALEFTEKTGIDRFAGSFGNIHGLSPDEPKLDTERIAKIRKLLPEQVSLTLHGGSGVPVGQIKEAIHAGINNIHINTEIREIYISALRKSLSANPSEITPYKIFSPAVEAIKEKVKEKLKLFSY